MGDLVLVLAFSGWISGCLPRSRRAPPQCLPISSSSWCSCKSFPSTKVLGPEILAAGIGFFGGILQQFTGRNLRSKWKMEARQLMQHTQDNQASNRVKGIITRNKKGTEEEQQKVLWRICNHNDRQHLNDCSDVNGNAFANIYAPGFIIVARP
uniref:HDC19956 n=1 Tax=Drosophila melanogaster TaxID=7227 RepID=Q6II26_DROME|nr:TPA_inf: HDC19956 [Drosophila melanogaster]